MTNIFKSFLDWVDRLARIKAASELARLGKHEEAKFLMEKIK